MGPHAGTDGVERGGRTVHTKANVYAIIGVDYRRIDVRVACIGDVGRMRAVSQLKKQ